VGVRIVYNSFHGRYSDNPRALYERLRGRPGLDHVWLADPAHHGGFPREAVTVDINGPGARQALEAADLVIASTHTEVDWDKQPGTRYLQTWHGTPLKRIHHDVLWAPEGRLDYLDLDVAKWDLLLSPNEVSTPRLRKAFGYDGEVLESGYPRNDLLSSPALDEAGPRVRHQLGIDDGVTTVLYAPTWRDNEVLLDPTAEVPLALDPAAFAAALGEQHALLVRSHNMATGRSRVAATPGVHDVSYHPDINELYAAADVLVTDYSSVMFDYAITGRPIVFYPYDLERYRDSIRGFYFELDAEDAPGPIVRSQPELLETLARLPGTTQQYADRYREFRRTYNALEDGHATDRVLERLGL
jgi:CDP-glycerol glycerophosphotransferase